MQAVLSALETLYTDPSNAAKEQANQWLQAFQKEPEAWETANVILAAPDAPQEPKLFAAQTFRTKIIYDLDQLPQEQQYPLKDTLVAAIRQAVTGPKAILTQLCLALADLLLQLPSWQNPVQEMVEVLGSDASTVPALLEFLLQLPEEYNSNSRITVTNDTTWRHARAGEKVLSLLSMYLQAPGITPAVQKQTLNTVRAWLRAGEVDPIDVQETPFFDFIFTALTSEELFDDGVDALVDLIHETQEVGENMQVIQAIVPRLVQQRPRLTADIAAEDGDRIQGYCRVLVEAGEWYAQLMLQHPAEFLPLVEAIADCAACSDLEVVGITLNFWYKLSVGLRKGGFLNDASCQPFLTVIGRLVDIVIAHLQYPQDLNTLTGQEKDDFRAFRHDIGDTLKDCCSVLGTAACLGRSLDIIESEVAKGASGSWQAIEAALFSMRAMGMRVDLQEDQIMPRVFAAIPRLPQSESKIRYAATLVVSRYTEWLSVHPTLIPSMLEYILAGFHTQQDDVAVASAAALKYLCKDCSQHLVTYLPALFDFTQQYGSSLHQDDLLEITEGFAHIIAKMAPAEAVAALQTFCGPLLAQVQVLSARSDGTATKAELTAAADSLERLNTYLHVNAYLSESLPSECAATAQQVWQILESLLVQFGSNTKLSERACSTIRRGMTFFGPLCIPLIPQVLNRMTLNFQQTGVSGYVWIAGRVPELLRLPNIDQAALNQLKADLQTAFTEITNKLVAMLSAEADPANIQDCIEDYLHFARNLIEAAPELGLLSDSLSNALRIAVAATTLLSANVALDGLDTMRSVVGHDCLSARAPPGADPAAAAANTAYANAVRSAFVQPDIGAQLVQIITTRIVTDLHEDCTPTAITLTRLIAERFPQELAVWVPNAVAQIPPKSLRELERRRFLEAFNAAIGTGNLGGVRSAFNQLDRGSRKDRERMLSSSTR